MGLDLDDGDAGVAHPVTERDEQGALHEKAQILQQLVLLEVLELELPALVLGQVDDIDLGGVGASAGAVHDEVLLVDVLVGLHAGDAAGLLALVEDSLLVGGQVVEHHRCAHHVGHPLLVEAPGVALYHPLQEAELVHRLEGQPVAELAIEGVHGLLLDVDVGHLEVVDIIVILLH